MLNQMNVLRGRCLFKFESSFCTTSFSISFIFDTKNACQPQTQKFSCNYNLISFKSGGYLGQKNLSSNPFFFYLKTGHPLTTIPGAVGHVAKGQWSGLEPHHFTIFPSFCRAKNNRTPMKAVPASNAADNT